MSAIKKLASQTAIYGLSSIIGRIAVWGLTPLFTAKMQVSEYGIFNDLYAFVTYFLVVLTFGMETAFFRYAGDDKLNEKPYTQSLVFVSGLAAFFVVIFSLASQPFASVLGYADRASLILMIVWITFFDVVTSLPMAKLRHDDRPIVFAVVSLFNIFITIALNLVFILILKQPTAEYVFLANLLASVLKFALLLLLTMPFMKRLEGRGKLLSKFAGINLLPKKWEIDRKLMRSMAAFGLFIMIAGLFGMFNQNADANFISRLWGDIPKDFHGRELTGDEMNGIYGANKKLAVFILLVTQAFRYAAEPFFFRHASKDKGRVVFAKVFHYFMLASLAAFLFISSFKHEFVSTRILGYYLIDKKFWSGLDAVAPLMLATVLWGAYTNLTIWYKLTKQVRFGILFSGVGVLLMVLFFVLFIPRWGYLGASYALLLTYLALTAMVYWAGQKYYFIPYRIGRMLVHALIYIGSYAINIELGDGPLFSVIALKKMMVCLVALALSYALERLMPIVWKEPVLPEQPANPAQ